MLKPTRKKSAVSPPRQSRRSTQIPPIGWLQRLPDSLRKVWVAALITLGIPLLIAAMPALLYFAYKADYSSSKNESNATSTLAFLGFLLFLLFVAIVTGSSLIGLYPSGEFCSRPSRYAGLYCITYGKAHVQFVLWVGLNWVVFWLSAIGIVAGFCHLASMKSGDT